MNLSNKERLWQCAELANVIVASADQSHLTEDVVQVSKRRLA